MFFCITSKKFSSEKLYSKLLFSSKNCFGDDIAIVLGVVIPM